MSALLAPVSTNTAQASTDDLRERAIRAVLKAMTLAAERQQFTVVADMGTALHVLEGGN